MARKNTARVLSALADCLVVWPTSKEATTHRRDYGWTLDHRRVRDDWKHVARDLKVASWRWEVDHGLAKHDAIEARDAHGVIKRSRIVGRTESGSRGDRWTAPKA